MCSCDAAPLRLPETAQVAEYVRPAGEPEVTASVIFGVPARGVVLLS